MDARAWDDGLGTGVSSIDTEHRLQVSLVNALEESLRHRRREAAVAERTFAQLVDFTSVHFHSEELVMRVYSYPRHDLHAAAHAKLMEQVRSIQERWEDDDGDEALDVVAELHGWLVNHIQTMDQAFTAWLEKNGLHPQP